MEVHPGAIFNLLFSYAFLVVVRLAIQFVQIVILLLLKRYLNQSYGIDLQIRSMFGEIRVSCLGIDISIERFNVSSKFFNSLHNSTVVFKLCGIHLEGDIFTASKKLSEKLNKPKQNVSVGKDGIFYKEKVSSFILKQFSFTFTNISVMMLFPKSLSISNNDCLIIHSTINAFQAGFEDNSKNQYALLVHGWSTKLLKSNTNRNEKKFLAQMSVNSINIQYFMSPLDDVVKLACNINGLSQHHMYASSAELSNSKASQHHQNRVMYLSALSIHYHQDVREIEVMITDEIYCLWSAFFHWHALEVYKDISNACAKLFPHEDVPQAISEPKFYNVNLKLDGNIHVAILLTNDGVDAQDKMIFETKFLEMAFQNKRITNINCEKFGIYFNDVHNCDIENFALRFFNEDNNPIQRKQFSLIEQEKNSLYEIAIKKFAIYFPYQFDFAFYFGEKFLSIFKWLKEIHRKNSDPNWMQSPKVGSPTIGSDFIIKIDNILMEIWDDDFEAKLSDNYVMMEDEYKEREKRWTKILEKIDETRRKGVIIPQSKVDDIENSYNIQNAKTYISRSKKMRESGQRSRKQLFIINADSFNLQLLSDTSFDTYDKKVSILRTIDCYSQFSEDLRFITLWCKQILCNMNEMIINLRDFSQPLFNAKDICLKGLLLGAQQEASPRAKRICEIDMGKDFKNFTIERNMTTLKIYHDITSKMSHFCYTHGACWEPILQQVNLSFEKINRPSTDPSPSLPWWDKIRFLFHGNLHIQSEQFSIVFHASLDPYNSTELIEISFCNANIQFLTGKIIVRNDLHVYVHTASKYDECRIIFWPDINLAFDLNWDCSGNKNDHHSVMPCARDKLPEYTCNQVHDSYRAFRSHHLNLIVSIETQESKNFSSESDKIPSITITIYNSTLRWLEKKVSTITGFPRLTRRGKLYNNTRPRKLPFMRLFKTIQLSVCIQKLEITYWSSFNRNRGFRIKSYNLTHSAQHLQTFIKINDNLIHRPRPHWDLIFMNSELKDVEMKLYKASEQSSFNNPIITDHFFLNIDKVSYKREAKLPQSVVDEDDGPNPVHRLIIHDLKGAWTKENRDIALALFDSYFKTQLLKRNLSTEALRLFKDQKGGSPSKSQGNLHEKFNLSKIEKGNAMNMLQKLISEVDSTSIVDTEPTEKVSYGNLLYGIEACQTNDVLRDNCLIELINSQVMLRGCETDGYVIISAAKATIFQRIHRPVWKNRVLFSKTTWEGSLECMQYYATVDAGGLQIEDVTWLDVDDIEERIYQESIETVQDLVGSGLCLGSVVKSEAGGCSVSESDRVPIQLQRIVSRCRCQFFYASYGENADPNNYEEMPAPPAENGILPNEPFEKEIAVDTFTIIHEDLNISTNSQQYSMIMDLVNNLLLYIEPHKKEVYEKQQRIRFSMQLTSLEDQREPISKLQDKVRNLLDKIKQNEKEIYKLFKNNSEQESRERKTMIELDLNQYKEDLNAASEDLNIMINAYKEAQLIMAKFKERQVAAQESRNMINAHVIRRNEVCFQKAIWRLTDADGQLGLSELVMENFFYNKVSKNDDSVQHSLELGYILVQNILPNSFYKEVLKPTELEPNAPVDRQRALRILCIEKAPVGGIAVKEHLEVNVVPMTIQMTMAFYQKMLKFFFSERGLAANAENNAKEAADDIAVGVKKKDKHKDKKRGDTSSTYSMQSSLSSTELQNLQHIEMMAERSSKNQIFVYVKISEVPLQFSYKGHKAKNLYDLQNVCFLLPTFEYHNRIWTWLDMLMELKREARRLFISQAIRHKLSNRFRFNKSSNSLAVEGGQSESDQTSHDEEKFRIMLGNLVVPNKTKTRSILPFGGKK